MLWFMLPVALVAGAGIGLLIGRRASRGPAHRSPIPADREYVLDLLRRAHGAVVAVLFEQTQDPVVAEDNRAHDREAGQRAVAVARLALADGRRHRLDEPNTVVGAGNARAAVALAFPAVLNDGAVERAQADAWRLAAAFAERTEVEQGSRTAHSAGATDPLQLCETLDSAALALCETVARRVEHATALVLRDEFSDLVHVTRVSLGGDRRLEGTSVLPGSAAARAIELGAPVAASTLADLLGHPRADRRRADDGGLVFPLRDGQRVMGALAVFGPPDRLGTEQREDVERMLHEAASRVMHLRAVEAREVRARTDELTGLPNRRGLERAMSLLEHERVALLMVDLDHFKRVNDTYGHVAGDAVLRHLSQLVRRVLRSQDVAARIGGEEFALWLPDADLMVAREVAERVRATVERTPVVWQGQEIVLTCSVGVAGVPETTTAVANLYPSADAALYRAKEQGRNRVEVAPPAAG